MKFPVIKAFGATIAYLAQHAVDLLKALWLPVTLLVGVQLYAMTPFLAAASSWMELASSSAALGKTPLPPESAPVLAEFGKWGLILMAGSAIAYPMMTVASLRHVVRGDALKSPFYLRYSGDELRVLAAYVLITIMIIVISLVGGLAGAVTVVILSLVMPQARQLFSALAELAVNLVTLWFRVRLSTLYPASIATGTIGFGAAWAAAKGSALSLFCFWVLIGVALAPIAIAAAAPFAGELLPLFSRIIEAGEDTAKAREAVIAILNAIGGLYSSESPSFALFAALLFAATLLSTAGVNVAAGIAWRYLTDGQRPSQAGAEALAA